MQKQGIRGMLYSSAGAQPAMNTPPAALETPWSCLGNWKVLTSHGVVIGPGGQKHSHSCQNSTTTFQISVQLSPQVLLVYRYHTTNIPRQSFLPAQGRLSPCVPSISISLTYPWAPLNWIYSCFNYPFYWPVSEIAVMGEVGL